MPNPKQRSPSQRVSKAERDKAKKNFTVSKAEQRAEMARKQQLQKTWKEAKTRLAKVEKVAKAMAVVDSLLKFDKCMALFWQELAPLLDKKHLDGLTITIPASKDLGRETERERKQREEEAKNIARALRSASKNMEKLMTSTQADGSAPAVPSVPVHAKISFLATLIAAFIALSKMRNRS